MTRAATIAAMGVEALSNLRKSISWSERPSEEDVLALVELLGDDEVAEDMFHAVWRLGSTAAMVVTSDALYVSAARPDKQFASLLASAPQLVRKRATALRVTRADVSSVSLDEENVTLELAGGERFHLPLRQTWRNERMDACLRQLGGPETNVRDAQTAFRAPPNPSRPLGEAGGPIRLGKGISRSHGDRLMKKVRSHLRPGEAVVYICKCNNFRPMVDRILVTDRRVLAIPTTGNEVPYSVARDRIVHVEKGSSFGSATLTVATSDRQKTTFKQMQDEDAAVAVAYLQQPIVPARPRSATRPPPPRSSQPGTGTIAEQLRELARLHDEGVLSDQEFVAAKARLLGQSAPAAPPGYLGVDNRDLYSPASAQSPQPATSSVDVNAATIDQLVAYLAVTPDIAARVAQARGSGRFENFDDLVRRADLAPHEAVRFRGRVLFGSPSQPRPSRPTGRVIDI